MWFQFPPNENTISIDQMVFQTEWTNKNGDNFFRAPNHFTGKLVQEGGCKALVVPPSGAPKNLPEVTFPDPPQDFSRDMITLKDQLSKEKSASSALRAELGATLHERDSLKLQVHELNEKVIELEARIEDEGLEKDDK